ncbi:MAG: SUMF1/EgtB/PvdO family nonheme iron enzyme [Acidobacteria bacterium]|nr:SUMF1/EgtB/PvdO family nonheme iron enzyme [Acidobacteriota bacterium]
MKECQLCKNCYRDDVATCPKDGMPTMHTIAGEPVLEGKYQLESRLGQGGMGVVYKARHAYLKTQLAIKIILPDLVGNDPQLVTRFRQEALAAAAIRHQNVVAVTDYGVIGGSIPFLVMEYVDGESLHDLLTREKVLSPERALEIMSAICSGVGAAHHQGIVHRDLKPLNIMICSDRPRISDAVKILDFGLAKIKSGELLGSFIQAQTTGLMGSPYYMAPEQWADDEPDSRSDIYSLGVMLYQMLAGDVPFKGSSIPAIMKKHISDPAPDFASMGVSVPPDVERAVLHTLEKDKEKRTGSVEQMIAELREAVHPSGIGIHTTSSGVFPVSSINVRTVPPQSRVWVDNRPVGESREDGWITLNGIQTGNHRIRVSKDGFEDWIGDILVDGTPKQITAELRSGTGQGIPAPTVAFTGVGPDTPQNMAATQVSSSDMAKTSVQAWDTGPQSVNIGSQREKRGFFSPLVIGAAGFVLLIALGGAGLGGAYMMGLFSSARPDPGNATNRPTPSPSVSPSAPPVIRTEMIEIPAGTFKMGRNDGRENERPEHEQQVAKFFMDKTEVTNLEYLAFVEATKKQEIPGHWVNGRPLPGQEKLPVTLVSYDDAVEFAKWRSERDGVTYRLPTEIEWEYAARNGAANDLYPWGDKFQARCAVLDQPNNDPKPVGTASCPNEWGVMDLIGNVFEWTSTEVSVYPGSSLAVKPVEEPHYMIRGGGAFYKSTGDDRITATFRQEVPRSTKSPGLGFRLVRN